MTEPTIINATPEPGRHQAIAIMMLINGILDATAGASFVGGALVSIIGVICLPVAALPLALGIFEILYASKMLTHKHVNPATIQTIAIFETASILCGNVIAMIVGILNLVFLEDPAVKNYMNY
jgi:hypothetical protein